MAASCLAQTPEGAAHGGGFGAAIQLGPDEKPDVRPGLPPILTIKGMPAKSARSWRNTTCCRSKRGYAS